MADSTSNPPTGVITVDPATGQVTHQVPADLPSQGPPRPTNPPPTPVPPPTAQPGAPASEPPDILGELRNIGQTLTGLPERLVNSLRESGTAQPAQPATPAQPAVQPATPAQPAQPATPDVPPGQREPQSQALSGRERFQRWWFQT
jgi:hypothetical protein